MIKNIFSMLAVLLIPLMYITTLVLEENVEMNEELVAARGEVIELLIENVKLQEENTELTEVVLLQIEVFESLKSDVIACIKEGVVLQYCI